VAHAGCRSQKPLWWRWWKLFLGQLLGRVFALRIVTAVCDMGVANSSCSVGRVRVQAGVDERYLLHDEREGIMGGDERALLRAEVNGIRRRNMRRVGRASFRRHFDIVRKKELKKQAAVKTGSRTCCA
jgi:hypothetical protein